MNIDRIGRLASLRSHKDTIVSSWTYSHKHLLVTMSLLVALVVNTWGLPDMTAEVIAYTAPCDTIECIIEAKAQEHFENNKPLYLEMSRTEAMDSIGREVVAIMNAPIVME